MSYGRGQKFWKGMREFDTKKEAERSPDFKIETYKNYEFQTWTSEKGKPVLRVYRGESGKAKSYYYYVSLESRQDAIDGFKKSADNQEVRKAERKAARKNLVNPFDVGDILYSSWGYDQTNIDFYEVVKVTNKSVYLEKIGKSSVENDDPYNIHVVPDTKSRSGNVKMKRVSSVSDDGKSGWVSLNSYSGASKWRGSPMAETHPMYGH
jgi:hypothetical protein